MIRTIGQFLGLLAALLAFAFECGASAILLILVVLGAAGHQASPGPAGVVACSALLATTIGLLYWTVRLIHALNARSTRGTEAIRVVIPGLEPLWDRYMDG